MFRIHNAYTYTRLNDDYASNLDWNISNGKDDGNEGEPVNNLNLELPQ